MMPLVDTSRSFYCMTLYTENVTFSFLMSNYPLTQSNAKELASMCDAEALFNIDIACLSYDLLSMLPNSPEEGVTG